MRYDSFRCRRRSLRLPHYDYARPGAYFVTICTQNRECLFGQIVDGQMQLNDAGRMVQSAWESLPCHYPGVERDSFVVMPNHIHGIIVLTGVFHRAGTRPAPTETENRNDRPSGVGAPLVGALFNRAGTRPAPTPTPSNPSLGDVIGGFKSLTTNAYILGVRECGWPPFDCRLWQRNYYEHVIRDEDERERIRQYIAENPSRWAEDPENPATLKTQERSTS